MICAAIVRPGAGSQLRVEGRKPLTSTHVLKALQFFYVAFHLTVYKHDNPPGHVSGKT